MIWSRSIEGTSPRRLGPALPALPFGLAAECFRSAMLGLGELTKLGLGVDKRLWLRLVFLEEDNDSVAGELGW